MSFDINIEGGATIRLLTAGKYCDKDIVITAGEGGVELPELTNPAAATDIVNGKEVIKADGTVMNGEVSESYEDYVCSGDGSVVWFDRGMGAEPFIGSHFYEDTLVRKDHRILTGFSTSSFGTATADDVAKGKTFTSAAGLLVEGKNESSGGAETVMVDIQVYTGFGAFMYYMSPDGVREEALPNGTYEVVKNSPIIIIYDGSTTLVLQYGSGYTQHYDNAWSYMGHSCSVLSFYEDGNVLYAEA